VPDIHYPPADCSRPGKGRALKQRRLHVHSKRREFAAHGRSAFTLIETLICVGVISIVASILLPTIGAARRQARLVVCTSNVAHICRALQAYAGLNEGRFPPEVTAPAPGHRWCDRTRTGELLAHRTPANISSLGGGVLACPADDAGGQRSYAMNFWASSAVDPFRRPFFAGRGVLWSTAVGDTSRLILVAEAWSAFGSGDWFTAQPTIGFAGERPGQRFGGGAGIAPPIAQGRVGIVNSELPFARHRTPATGGSGAQPKGRIQIGFADGHVELLTHADLVHPDGRSTRRALWTPIDHQLEP
jgi:prepilin-type N-terminal cleavage/methylation domain-containing protein/prepilin-type processing-associated H-X9-DG protein